MTNPILRLNGISKSYGKTRALHPLSLDIEAGQFVTFLGPSGCGKSTTLRVLGGFETADTGQILLEGQDITTLPPERRHMNMVFQDYALFPHMSVRRNIGFGLELMGKSRKDIAARCEELVSFLELGPYADRRPDQLSGGQRQRVALARALAPDPAVLLLDEPLGALDARLRAQVQEELKTIQKRTHKTFFFVTHDQDEAMTMSDRIIVMNEGRIEQDGTPQDLYFHPTSRFVAEFIGETNLLTGESLSCDNGDLAMSWRGQTVTAHCHAERPRPGQEVTGSLRHENLRLLDGPEGASTAFLARPVGQVFHGARVSVDFRPEHAPDKVLRAAIDPRRAKDLGEDAVWIGWDAEDMSLLRD